MEILEVLKSKYCWIVIFISIFIGYYLIHPFLRLGISVVVTLLSITFLGMFSMSIACMVRTIKLSYTQLKSHGTMIGIIGYVFGFISLQTCFVSGMCVSNLIVPLLYTFLPVTFVNIFSKYSELILGFSVLLIVYSLFSMGCFKRTKRDNF